ncbi:hypothetical protein [Helicobacter marmotae]|uniref:hypothetical protein n=1 Tax=Helicobacter marmotae TaxID=152490 RepID=UPI001473C2F1|nr:hypothetical protein [Helicobacter marmotae]
MASRGSVTTEETASSTKESPTESLKDSFKSFFHRDRGFRVILSLPYFLSLL